MDIQRWSVGDAELVRVVDFDIGVPPPPGAPVPAWLTEQGFVDADGQVRLASSAIGLVSGDERVVVDPWLAFDPDRTDPSTCRATADRLLDGLAGAGFPADEVGTVVNTHVDGIGWNLVPTADGARWVPAFPNARYRYSRAELDSWANYEPLAPLTEAGVVDPFEPPAELAAGVTAELAPGHGPSHCVVRVRSAGAEALIGGHLFISPFSVSDPTQGLDDDVVLAADVRRGLLAGLAEHDGLLVAPLLGGPGGGYVRADGRSWRLSAEPT